MNIEITNIESGLNFPELVASLMGNFEDVLSTNYIDNIILEFNGIVIYITSKDSVETIINHYKESIYVKYLLSQ